MTQALSPNAALIGQPGSRYRLDTPALLIDLEALERNIAAMAAHARAVGVALRPHAKTHKSVRIARMQVDAGAIGICCATLGEAEVMVNAGIPGVHITSPQVTPPKIAQLIAVASRRRFEFGLRAISATATTNTPAAANHGHCCKIAFHVGTFDIVFPLTRGAPYILKNAAPALKFKMLTGGLSSYLRESATANIR